MKGQANHAPLNPKSIRYAHERIQPYIHCTPLLTSKTLDAIASSHNPAVYLTDEPTLQYRRPHDSVDGHQAPATAPGAPGFRLYFKAENFQRGGAFKARGAFFAILSLAEELGMAELRSRGVITHSSGNHAQALALAAVSFDIPAYIVMPSNAPPSKIAGARRYATEVVLAAGSTKEEREEAMSSVQKRTHAVFIPPFDHPNIILGQGTVGREMQHQLEEFQYSHSSLAAAEYGGKPYYDAVIAPLGGGGLLGGVATYFGDRPETKVFGSEPNFEGADDGARGLRQGGRRIEVVKSLTIADGLRMPVGIVNWGIVSDATKVYGIYSVGEEEIKTAMRLIFERLKIVAEPSACVPLAVVLFNAEFRKVAAQLQAQEGKTTWQLGIVISGGNTSMEKISFLFS
jgi:threonine dehydratase